jgi:hypothetical protein
LGTTKQGKKPAMRIAGFFVSACFCLDGRPAGRPKRHQIGIATKS